jgi:adenine phosphoribosyltransferase
MNLKDHISVITNWPKQGVDFLDISGLVGNPLALSYCVRQLVKVVADNDITSIVAVDSRGFLFAGAVGVQSATPVVLARKKGKLPGPCYSHAYNTEYSQDTIEIQTNVMLGPRPLIIDDLLATGGTILAVNQLIKQSFLVDNVTAATVINLKFLPGEQLLNNNGIVYKSIVNYE